MSIDRHRRPACSAHTLVEVLMAIALGAMLLTAVVSFGLYSGRSLAIMSNYVEMESHSRTALDTLSRDVRQAVYLMYFSPHVLVLQDWDNRPLVFWYSERDRTLRKLKDGSNQVLLEGCDFLQFSMFQRTPIGGTFKVYPATSPATAKVIEVKWHCVRNIVGTPLTTESVQTARIVIRKKRLASSGTASGTASAASPERR